MENKLAKLFLESKIPLKKLLKFLIKEVNTFTNESKEDKIIFTTLFKQGGKKHSSYIQIVSPGKTVKVLPGFYETPSKVIFKDENLKNKNILDEIERYLKAEDDLSEHVFIKNVLSVN